MLISIPRRALLAGAVGLASASGPASAQQDFPSRPIRIIIPTSPGGPSDVLGRIIAEELRAVFPQPVLAENRPSANGSIAMDTLAHAPKDGHTVGYVLYGSVVLAPLLVSGLPYKVEDLQPLTTIYRGGMALAVAKDLPIHNARDFVEYAKQHGPLSYGSIGRATPAHLVMEMLAGESGAAFENVVYRGENLAVTDMLAGNIPAVCGGLASFLAQHRSGAIRVIAITVPQRLSLVPDVPTFREVGYPVEFSYFQGLALPAGTPRPIVDRLHAAIAPIIMGDRIRAVLPPDQIPEVMSPDAFTALIQSDQQRLGNLIRSRGITAG